VPLLGNINVEPDDAIVQQRTFRSGMRTEVRRLDTLTTPLDEVEDLETAKVHHSNSFSWHALPALH